MDALTEPLDRVIEAARWFVIAKELRVLHVTTSAPLRIPVLQQLCAAELYEENTAPFFVLEAPCEPEDDGFDLRSDELRADWEALVDDAPPESIAPLWSAHQAGTPLARFALELDSALRRLRAPMESLVIVLAPVWVRDPVAWREALRALVGSRRFASARFVIVEADGTHIGPLLAELGASAEHVDVCIDEEAVAREAAARLAAVREAPRGADPGALVGHAGPAVAPPVRRGASASASERERKDQAAALGVHEALLDPEFGQQVRIGVVSAALAMRDGKHADALTAQREARDLCLERGLLREGVINELVLAGYALQAGGATSAKTLFEQAGGRARDAGHTDLEVQAQFGVAACWLLAGRKDEAALAYSEAGRTGEASGALALAIEGYRMCGQLLASEGRDQQAAQAFGRALTAAQSAGTDTPSSAPEAARALAAVCRKHGMSLQASALEEQASALEAQQASSLEEQASALEAQQASALEE